MSPAWRPAGKEAEMSTHLINHLHIPTGVPKLEGLTYLEGAEA
jgi:hypothetical protein